MLITDYTVEWVTLGRAIFSWDGGSADAWFTVYIDGYPAGSVYGAGELNLTISLDIRKTHSVAIVQQAIPAGQESPEAPELLQPVIRWLPVENAAEYYVYEVLEDDTEYLVRRVIADTNRQIYAITMPKTLAAGVRNCRVRVYAKGSFGLCEAPTVVSGVTVGHPARAAHLSVEDASSGLELTIAPA